jgi:dihydroflavonol-4-reductase
MSSELVLVTGGSSFVGLHVIHQAIQQGYKVRTTIRNDSKKDLILEALKDYDSNLDFSKIEFVKADLLSDEGWTESAQGVKYVLHVASPFPASTPKDENDLIKPAREGTMRVLKAAKKSGTCKRVVITSSVAAIAYGNKPSNGKSYTEQDWTNVDGPNVQAYVKSKTLAEQAAWNYVKEGEGKGLELATVNPVGIFGPPIRPQDDSTTCDLIKQMLQGKMPAVPRASFGVVDVRDVASLHLLAMTKEEANGQRYLANGDSKVRSLLQMSKALKAELAGKASKTPSMELPDWLVKGASYVVPPLKAAVTALGEKEDIVNEKAIALGWKPRTPEEAVVATAQRFIEKGIC